MAPCLLALSPCMAAAATISVGPSGSGADFTQVRDVFNQRDLNPGDIVQVAGSATYQGGVVVGQNDSGTAANPVVIRWNRVGTRPVLEGGTHTIKFQQSNHVVFEGFEVRGGTSTCVFNEAHNVTVRDAVIHACAAHGILGADGNSGSFTLEYSEVFDAGTGATKHPIYMQSDEVTWPDAVFRMRFNYIHDGNGGNLLKSRHQRNEIHYNWFEGSTYQEIELIGPDCQTQQTGWRRDLKREDSDVVGNVIVHTSSWGNAIRIGGDLNGASDGRVRLVNNTILIDRAGSANAVYVQLGLESLEMHNNVIYQNGAGAPAVVGENTGADAPVCAPFGTQPWSGGRKVAGSHNWVEAGSSAIPLEWSGTTVGSDPLLANIAQRALRPQAGSALVNMATSSPATPSAFPFPAPLPVAAHDPPLRAKLAMGGERPRLPNSHTLDIGALEQAAFDALVGPFVQNGSSPLLPPDSGQSAAPTASAANALAPTPAATAPPMRDGARVVVQSPHRDPGATRLRRWVSIRWHALMRLLGWRS